MHQLFFSHIYQQSNSLIHNAIKTHSLDLNEFKSSLGRCVDLVESNTVQVWIKNEYLLGE